MPHFPPAFKMLAAGSQDELKTYRQQAADQGRRPQYGVPEKIVLVDTLIKTRAGKLNKNRMRQAFGEACGGTMV